MAQISEIRLSLFTGEGRKTCLGRGLASGGIPARWEELRLVRSDEALSASS